ncbi:dienelactone hydrolase family protein [Cupriavidus necator]|uniref:dienelactone hydrolase family protein n=1 Tax=Cupriavidus necator TaxID=106590 RepID=UPI00339D86F7
MGKTIQITANDGHNLSAYVAEKPGNERWAVVIQEAFGVNDHIRNVCDRFADKGLNVIAPAVFDRVERDLVLPYSPEGVSRYTEIRKALRKEDVLLDVVAAADATGSERTGIVGYCFGGTVSWWAATETSRFAAASCWYGGGIFAEKTAKPNCPVQMHFGGMDTHIPLEHVDAIRKQHPEVELWVYEEAEHGFGCDARPSFHEESYTLALQRTLVFFEKNLDVKTAR